MKSLVSNVHTVALAILADVLAAYPPMSVELSRDSTKLSALVMSRGLGVYTLDLPSLDGVLTDLLESGRLVLGTPLTKAVSKRIRVPCLFRGLWLRVVHNDGTLRQEPDPTAISFLRQIFCLGKKLEVPCSPQRQVEAINEFRSIEYQMRSPTLDWGGDAPFDSESCKLLNFGSLQHHSASPVFAFIEDDTDRLCAADSDLLERLDSICRDVSTRYGLFDSVTYEKSRLSDPMGRASGTKNGPGAVSDRKGKEEKFIFSNWPEKLQQAFPIDFFGHRPHEVGNTFRNLEHASKLIMVPKTAKAPRLIAAEPSYHQWCQQLVLGFLVDKTPDVFSGKIISFQRQELSHPLVSAGSLDRSTVTVDLSSASDRLSCWAIERAWKSNLSLLNAFHACRTRVIGPSSRVDIDHAHLRKFATMGSALTFPVQTIFYACIALASLPGRPRLDDQVRTWGNQVRVFGDDIIVPKEGYAGLMRLLQILGLKVNKRKSFSQAFFRESCGFDAYKGYDVTPIKPRHMDPTTPTGRQSLLDLSNNLHLKGFWRGAQAALTLLPTDTLRFLPVVSSGSGVVAVTSFCKPQDVHLRRRWNARLQRTEVLRTVFSTRTETTYRDGTDYTLQSLHSLHSRRFNSDYPQKGSLGRVVKAVTRERRSWEALDLVLCPPSLAGRT
jgi:hypothetical protein